METPDYLAIIEEAKKYFFAEDIMSYFMISCRLKPCFRIPMSARCFRSIPRAFNDVMETALCFLYSRISVHNTFRSFQTNGMLSKGAFLLFAHNMENRYFPNGYNAQKLLYFSTYLVYLAVSFYKAGETDIPQLAVCYIFTAIKLFGVPEDDLWNDLSIAALRYIKVAFKCGFAKMCDFESMKIQFVVKRSFRKQTADDNDGIIEESIIDAELKKLLLNLYAELKKRLSMIDCPSSLKENNQNKPEIETHSKESLEKKGEKASNEKQLDTERADPPTKTSEFKRGISLPQKYRVFQVLSGLVNSSVICLFPENCDCSFSGNSNFSLRDMRRSAFHTEASRSKKSESNITSIKSNTSEKTENSSKYFDESKQKIQSSTTVTYGQRLQSPRISGEKYSGCFSPNRSHKKSPNSTSNEESFSLESTRPNTPEEFPTVEVPETEVEDCPLKTVDFDCDFSFNGNSNFSSKDTQRSVFHTEASRSQKSESNITSIKSITSEKTENNSKYFDESQQEIKSSTTVTYDQKLQSPRLSGRKYGGGFSPDRSYKKSPNSTSNEESLSMESTRPNTPEEIPTVEEPDTEVEDCPLKTVDFDICDPIVEDMAMTDVTDIALYGETHESFLSNEDNFNSTFDILSLVHNMAINFGHEMLDIEIV